MSDISHEAQKEVARIRDMISVINTWLPTNENVNFAIYETIIDLAEKAIREQDGVLLVKLLPTLKEID